MKELWAFFFIFLPISVGNFKFGPFLCILFSAQIYLIPVGGRLNGSLTGRF
jgi:hypothetical protein